MKFLVSLLVALACAAGYIRIKQPHTWNTLLVSLKAPEPGSSGDASTPDDTAGPDPDSSDAPRPVPKQPEIISPDDKTYVNPDHVHSVDQPDSPSSTPVPSTPPVTPAPTPTPAGNTPAPAPSSSDAAPPSATPIAGLSRTSIPTTITTLSGRVYQDCVLSRVTPDGISFTHAAGVANVPFTDLDPQFGATFNYDPVAAQKYEQDEANREAASDAQRAQVVAAAASPASSPPEAPAASATEAPAPAQPSSTSSLTADQRAEIQAQIDALNADIAFMEREEDKVTVYAGAVVYHDVSVTHGAYAEKIVQEKEQVAALQRELNGP